MPKQEGQKSKLVTLLRILEQRTDENHRLNVPQLVQLLENQGILAERKSIYSDIDTLRSLGYDIQLQRGRGGGYWMASRAFELSELKLLVDAVQSSSVISARTSKRIIHKLEALCSDYEGTQLQRGRGGGYWMASRAFELSELKLLVDAVESSRFITAKKSERLIGKLGKLTSESHARQLDRHIYMEGTAKPENECIYYSVDEIHNAIQDKRQITFQYYEYTPQKEKILKHNGYRYQFSPYALIWSRDCYYAVGWSEKHGKIAQFRVDRMTAVEPLEHTAVQTPDFDPAEYVRKVFGMYPDNLCTVELLCDNEVMRSVIDRFGENVQTETVDEQHFRATVEVAPSPPFFSWVFTFSGKIRIVSPAAVLEEMRDMAAWLK